MERAGRSPHTRRVPLWAVLYAASALATAGVLVAVGLPLLGGALLAVEVLGLAAVLAVVGRRRGG